MKTDLQQSVAIVEQNSLIMIKVYFEKAATERGTYIWIVSFLINLEGTIWFSIDTVLLA